MNDGAPSDDNRHERDSTIIIVALCVYAFLCIGFLTLFAYRDYIIEFLVKWGLK